MVLFSMAEDVRGGAQQQTTERKKLIRYLIQEATNLLKREEHLGRGGKGSIKELSKIFRIDLDELLFFKGLNKGQLVK